MAPFELPEGWRWREVAEIAASEKYSCVGGPFGSKLTRRDYVDQPGVPVIRGSNLAAADTRFVDSGFAFVSELKVKEDLVSNLAYPGDLLFTQRGTLGQVGKIPATARFSEYVISQSQMKLTVDPDQASSDFVYAYFRSHFAQDFIRRHAITTGVPHINLSILRSFPVPVPPLPEQRRIAAILGALDDKIELNRKMNRTLEEIAQTLFQAWFVDFEPVWAKLEKRQLAHQSALMELFPAEFEDSEIGEIPQGWHVQPLPEIIEVNPTRKLAKGEVAPYLEMKNMPTDGARALDWYDREYGSGTRFQNGDVLVARITPCLENGKTAIVDFLEDGQIGWGSTEYLVFRSKPPLPPEYAYFLARTPGFRRFAIANMTGSSGRQRVRVSALDHYLVPVPPKLIAEQFGVFAGSVLKNLKQRDQENQTLAEIRDTLLPKLISGEIRVPEAEDLVEEAV